MLSKRYEIIKDLGEGTFGKVVQCKDYESGTFKINLKPVCRFNLGHEKVEGCKSF